MLRKLTMMLSALTLLGLAATGCATSPAVDNAAGAEGAASAESTETAAEFQALSWAEVETAMTQGAVLVDARSADGYAEGHITGAVNGDPKDEAALKAALPAEKDKLLVFYCGGPQCSASTKAASLAASWGYTNVAEYKGGYPEWSQAQQPEAETDPQATN